MAIKQLKLKKDKERFLERFHPWIFSGAFQHIQQEELTSGEWVEVVNHTNKIVATGHFQHGSIMVRVLAFNKITNTATFYNEKIALAYDYRKQLLLPSSTTNVFRLIHGEGDGLPGLVIDIYNNIAVIETHSFGMYNDRHLIKDTLLNNLNYIKAIYCRPEHTTECSAEYLYGTSTQPIIVNENNNKFYVNVESGQKTGFFIDQRENRTLLQHYVKHKKVLNTFCYTGGFSISALVANAKLVHSVDISSNAIQLTKENIQLNNFDSDLHTSFAEDVFTFIENTTTDYDVIILDPPAFAKHMDARHRAVKGYQRLNTLALKKIKKGGILFTFSCSQVIDKKLFYNTIISAAIIAKRNIRILHQLSQATDHPISIFHPEGDYLKGFVLYVE